MSISLALLELPSLYQHLIGVLKFWAILISNLLRINAPVKITTKSAMISITSTERSN